MNCKNYQAKIEELSGEQILSADILRHLESCGGCRAFNAERAKLRQILGSLQTINAPKDFNFRLKAKLRKQENAPMWAWQKLVGAAAATVAALVLSFFAFKGALLAPQSTQNAKLDSQPTITQTETPAPEKQAASVTPIQNQELPASNNSSLLAEANNAKPRFSRNVKKIENHRKQNARLNNSEDEIFVKDSAVDVGKQKTPPGIPNRLEPPKKHDAREFLRTFGVETEVDNQSLRVTESSKSDLQTGDVIEKINNQNPLSLSGNDFKEINLTVRRKEQRQEIKLKTKP